MTANPKWPSVQPSAGRSEHDTSDEEWPSVEKRVGRGSGLSDSAKSSTLARNHPLDGKEFHKKRSQTP